MSLFSQSLQIGENTQKCLEKLDMDKSLINSSEIADQLEIIEESPTNKTYSRYNVKDHHRTRHRSMKHDRKQKLNRSKSDSALETSLTTKSCKSSKTENLKVPENYSEHFKCSMDFEMNLANIPLGHTNESLSNENQNLSKFFFESNLEFDNNVVNEHLDSIMDLDTSIDNSKNIRGNKICGDAGPTNLHKDEIAWSDSFDEYHVKDNTKTTNEHLDSIIDVNNSLLSTENIQGNHICGDANIAGPSNHHQDEIAWSESFDEYHITNENQNIIPNQDNQSIILDDEIALGIDNITFTQDFMQINQPHHNQTHSSNNDAAEISQKITDVSKFMNSEMEKCRKLVNSTLNESSLQVEMKNCSQKSFITLNDSKDSLSNIILNVSDDDDTVENVENEHQSVNNIIQLDNEMIVPNLPSNLNDMKNWGLPETVLKEYKSKGIEKMFDWQCKCLSNKKVLFDSTNLVYSAPTSAGKTLVSEILMIKNVIEKKKKALFILPFISVVREKMFYLQDLLASSGVNVEGFFGGYTPPRGFENTQIAVCTIEKANAIINRLLEQNKVNSIGCIVVDEIHLISDPGRGYILELLLTKCEYISKIINHHIQIITMSATLPNLPILTKWLKAEYFHTDFRPIELHEMIKIDNKIYDSEMKIIRHLSNDYEQFSKDQDAIGQLCMETINMGCAVIVFCPSKDWCESLSHHLASFIYAIGKSKTEIGQQLRKHFDMEKIAELKSQLRNCPSGLDNVLEKTLSYGVAFHHAGLTTDERDIIESGFKIGTLKIIVATSTLSSGVNLPARRVIIRSPLFGGKPMNSLTYKQMIGRAGRMGRDTLGESILICSESNKNVGKELVCAQLKSLKSCLSADNYVHLKRAILEIIAAGVCSTKDDIEKFVNATLLASEMDTPFTYENTNEKLIVNQAKASDNIRSSLRSSQKNKSQQNHQNVDDDNFNPISNCMEFLITYEFIRLQLNEQTNELNYVPTRLGQACLASSMPPSDGFLLFSELQKSRQCFVLESELHAIYLVTPFSVCYQMQDIDWLSYLDMWEKLSTPMRRVGEIVGIRESFLVKAMRNHKLDYKQLQIHKRFYTALALQELVNEEHVTRVAQRYKCTRGLLQSLQQMASTFAGIVTSFCNALNWNMLALIIGQFKDRLFFGIHRDLIDLMRIANLTNQQARALYNGGIQTLIDLANGNVFEVETILYNSLSFDTIKHRDGESSAEAEARNRMRHLYVTGKSGLTVREIAKLIIDDARHHLEQEIGIQGGIKWANNEVNDARTSDEKSLSIIEVEHNKTIAVPSSAAAIIVESEDMFSYNLSPRQAIKSKLLSDNVHTKDVPEKRNKIETDLASKETIVSLIKESNHQIQCPTSSSKYLTKQVERTIKNNPMKHQQIDLNEMDSITFTDLESLSVNSSNRIEPNEQLLQTSLEIVNVFGNREFFNNFLTEINNKKEITLSIGGEKIPKSKPIIGGNLLINQLNDCPTTSEHIFHFDEQNYVACVAICLDDQCVYYFNLQIEDNDNSNANKITFQEKQIFFQKLLQRTDIILQLFDAKDQLKILYRTLLGLENDICPNIEDPKIVDWLFQPIERKTLFEMVEQYAPKYVDILKIGGITRGTSCLGLNSESAISAKVRSSVECFTVCQILKGQKEILKKIGNEHISKAFYEIEMPIQRSLTRMELVGFAINYDELTIISESVAELMQKLEKQIYQLHGKRFNIASSNEVAKVLGLYNKKTSENGKTNKITTNKQVLEKIADPISNFIVQHRKLSAIQSNTLQPLLKLNSSDKNKKRIYGNSISFTSTGRISMHEPNLQNVAKDFVGQIDSFVQTISCRSAFQVNANRMLVSADFCQLEMRILTHLCEDPTLMNIMQSHQDVFTLIAAKWNQINENRVTEIQRNNAKQICYGIIYGMGVKSLADNLKCSEDDAKTLSETFHVTYPGIRSYINKVVQFVRKEGYVETLSGRRRYFPQMKTIDGNNNQAQFERQAVNTIIQGSAADISKYAIIRMERNVQKYSNNLKININNDQSSTVDLVLHVHDELIYECPANKARQIAKILKSSMENCAKLSLPLIVKIKMGNSWGTLKICDIQ